MPFGGKAPQMPQKDVVSQLTKRANESAVILNHRLLQLSILEMKDKSTFRGIICLILRSGQLDKIQYILKESPIRRSCGAIARGLWAAEKNTRTGPRKLLH